MGDALDEVVKSSANFGYLAEHEPLLAYDGASAESYVFIDPEVAMFKARRFLDVLSKKAVAVFGVSSRASRLYERIIDLRRAGVIDKDVYDLCDLVRKTGNEAVHGRMRDVHAALRVVQHCFDLGLWLHNTITRREETKVFVMPQEPDLAPSPRDADGPAILTEIRAMLATFERRLVLLESDRKSGDPLPLVAELMKRQTVVNETVRSSDDRVENRRHELAANLSERLVEDQVRSEALQPDLRRSAELAAALLKREADRLGEIAREVSQRSEEDSGWHSTSVINVAGDESNNFVVGNLYGSSVNPTFGRDRRR